MAESPLNNKLIPSFTARKLSNATDHSDLEELAALCSAPGIELVSVDAFNTCIFRDTPFQDDIFRRVAQLALMQGKLHNDDVEFFVQRRRQAEIRARDYAQTSRGNQEVTLDEICAALSPVEAVFWRDLELQVEVQAWSLHQGLIALLQDLQRLGKKIVVLSDMYLPQQTISRFLRLHAACLYLDDVRVSGVRGVSKVTGTAFDSLLHDYQLEGGQVVHIGDDLVADIQMAQSRHIRTFHLKQPAYLNQLARLERTVCGADVYGVALLRTQLMSAFEGRNDAGFRALGAVVYGPVLVGWAKWILQTCRHLGIRRIYCLLREGQIIADILRSLDANFEIRILAISRRSSFLPELGRLSVSTLHQLAGRRGYSLADLAIDCGQPLSTSLQAVQHHCLSDLVDDNHWPSIVDWVEACQVEISNYLQAQKQLLTEYLSGEGISCCGEQALLDWGCGGSLLQTIGNLLNLRSNHYFLYYCKESASSLLGRGHLHCFQPTAARGQSSALASSPEVSEILLNQALPTTIAYRRSVKNVVPVRAEADDFCQQAVLSFRQGVFECIAVAKQVAWISAGIDITLRAHLFGILYRLHEYPLASEAALLADLQVPVATGVHVPLLSPAMVCLTASGNAEQLWRSYLRGTTKDIKNSWWYPGLLALAFPGFLQQQGHFFREVCDDSAVAQLVEAVQRAGCRQVVIYGAGEIGCKLAQLLLQSGTELCFFVDRRAAGQSISLLGLPVFAPEDADLSRGCAIVIASRVFAEEIFAFLVKLNANVADKVIRL